MKKKSSFLLLWSGICVVLYIALLAVFWPQNIKATSNMEIKVQSGQKLIVSAASSVNAASENFFIFRKGNEIIAGIPADKPLGMTVSSYFVAKDSMSAGEWLVENGSDVSVVITAKDSANLEITVMPSSGNRVGAMTLALLLIAIAWIIGLVV